MKYLWIVILIVVYIGWTASAISDFIGFCKKPDERPDGELKDSTKAWFVGTIIILFIWSFLLWISG